ncbi:hypothetical protein TMSI_15170 [Klebsiella quasipneumoniae]|nr:hypothetical protein TMSI_15170 [Klebsiella quasipneumoniae]
MPMSIVLNTASQPKNKNTHKANLKESLTTISSLFSILKERDHAAIIIRITTGIDIIGLLSLNEYTE